MEGSTTSSTHTCSLPLTAPDHDDVDEHNMWNPTLGALLSRGYRRVYGAVLDDESLGRTALSCHSALDILCSKDVCALNDVTVCAISVTV